jgi:hypothetical protein
MAKLKATVRGTGAKRQAIKSRGRDFSALESFVNRDLSVFLKQWPDYAPFTETEYRAAEIMNWYREQLRKVWAGRDPAGIRLKILLGLNKTPHWKPWRALLGDKLISQEDTPELIVLDPTFGPDAFLWTEIVQNLQQPSAEPRSFEENGQTGTDHSDPIAFESFGLPEAKLVFDWQRSAIFPEFRTKFQATIYNLMRQSWRAKICRNCQSYFVADKPAQVHCSHECYVEIKNKKSLDHWNKEGKAKRTARTKLKQGMIQKAIIGEGHRGGRGIAKSA